MIIIITLHARLYLKLNQEPRTGALWPVQQAMTQTTCGI